MTFRWLSIKLRVGSSETWRQKKNCCINSNCISARLYLDTLFQTPIAEWFYFVFLQLYMFSMLNDCCANGRQTRQHKIVAKSKLFYTCKVVAFVSERLISMWLHFAQLQFIMPLIYIIQTSPRHGFAGKSHRKKKN